jgi:hypothetical protein
MNYSIVIATWKDSQTREAFRSLAKFFKAYPALDSTANRNAAAHQISRNKKPWNHAEVTVERLPFTP